MVQRKRTETKGTENVKKQEIRETGIALGDRGARTFPAGNPAALSV